MNQNQLKVDRTKDKLRRLAQKDGNKFCFDCGVRGPMYVVTNFHIFVCSICSSAHRSFQHKVKGISMCKFLDSEVIGVEVGGNDVAEKVWLACFTGSKPHSGDVHAIQNFVESTFVKEQYIDATKKKELEENIKHALNPETKPHLTAAAPTQLSPPPGQSSAAVSQTAPSTLGVTATHQLQRQQQPQPQPPQVDLLGGLFAAPDPMKVAPPASNPDDASSAKPPSNLLQDLFSAPQPAQPFGLAPQSSYVQPQQQQQQQHFAAPNPNAFIGNTNLNFQPTFLPPGPTQAGGVGGLPPYPAQPNNAPACTSQEGFFPPQNSYNQWHTNNASVDLQPRLPMMGVPASQSPFIQNTSVDYFQPSQTNWRGHETHSAPAMTAYPSNKRVVAEDHSNDKVVASLNPFGTK